MQLKEQCCPVLPSDVMFSEVFTLVRLQQPKEQSYSPTSVCDGLEVFTLVKLQRLKEQSYSPTSVCDGLEVFTMVRHERAVPPNPML